MRVVVDLDADIARALTELASEQDEPVESSAIRVIRAGLACLAERNPHQYGLEPVSLGTVCTGVDLVKALELADQLEDDELLKRQAV